MFSRWPLLRQLAEGDRLGLGAAAISERTRHLRPRTQTAEKVAASVCPYCAVGCGQLVYAESGRVTQIEGDPNSPISRGRLCPKGSASKELVNQEGRLTRVKYRRPHGTRWEELDLDVAMDMIAERVLAARDHVHRHVEVQLLPPCPVGAAVLHPGEAALLVHQLFAGGSLRAQPAA